MTIECWHILNHASVPSVDGPIFSSGPELWISFTTDEAGVSDGFNLTIKSLGECDFYDTCCNKEHVILGGQEGKYVHSVCRATVMNSLILSLIDFDMCDALQC